jgi:cytochrome o ubiquinol oxidase subunit 3
MTESLATSVTRLPDPHQETFSKNVLGFWIYLMTDCIIFATLFAVYAVLHNSTFGGPSGKDIFDISTTLAETLLLLTSSATCGLALLSAIKNKKNHILGWLAIAFLLGLSFVVLEVNEFHNLIKEGHSWHQSAFLSSFFTLVGTHGFHVSVGLLWIIVIGLQIAYRGLNLHTFRRLVCFGMFWHFLDLVWIFIFTFVYLMGVV